MSTVLLKVTALVEEAGIDEGIEGVYRVELHDRVPHDHRANAALDVFHGDIAIDVLDHFEFDVTELDGTPILESDDVESYRYVDAGEVYPVISETPPIEGGPGL